MCCVEEGFVGRLLPLVCSLPLIVLPPPCLFLEMPWFDPQARGCKMHMLEQSNISPMVVKILSRDIVNGCFFYFYMWPLKGGLEERTGVDTISGYQQQIVDIRYHRISTAKDISTKGYIDSWCRPVVHFRSQGLRQIIGLRS